MTATSPGSLSRGGRYLILVTAFLGWMLAGLEMATFPHATGPIVRDMLGDSLSPDQVKIAAGQWFGWFICAFLIGAALGGLVFGWLGDRIGRARAMGFAVLCYSLLTGVCYFATSLEILLVLRFLACFGIGGMWPNGVALASEAWSNASRPLLAGLIGTAANVGIAGMGAIGKFRPVTEDDWRWVMFVGMLPAVLGVFILTQVPESPKWLATRGSKSDTGKGGAPIRTVFGPTYLRLTIIGILLGTIPLLGGWGTSNWLIKWADQVGKEIGDSALKASTQMYGSLGAAIGSLAGGWAPDQR